MSAYFTPISVQGASYGNPFIRRKRQPFNDRRLYSTWSLLEERMMAEQQRCIQQIAESASQAARFYRFYGNTRVSNEELIMMNCSIKSEVVQGRHLLCIGDSTSFNMNKRLGRIKDADKLGILQDGKTPGFFSHVNLAVDAHTSAVVGLADVLYWTRPKGIPAPKQSAALQDKESYRWVLGASNAKRALQAAQRITYVFDREADSFELLDYLQNELANDFVIRSKHNRKVRWQNQELSLNSCLEQSQVVDTYQIDLPALDHYSWTSGKRVRRQARKATIELRYEALEVLVPEKIKAANNLQLFMVEAKEVLTTDLPPGEKPLCWRLWTTHHIDSASLARSIIQYYLLRWIIEQLFRTAKKKGFDQEATELESLDAILKQTSMVLKAATTVLQLVYARNRVDAQPIEDVFDQKEITVLNKVKERLEGKTEKQKNPFPPDKLSWAAWIIARLGGWKGYQSQKPPGPITMKRGLDKFKTILEAYLLFNTS